MRVYSKRAGAMKPPATAVYVGRPTKWGNPFVVGVHGKQGECVQLYAEWLSKQPALLEQARAELRGRDLVCWCAPLPCHADVLLRVANEDARECAVTDWGFCNTHWQPSGLCELEAREAR